MYVLRNAGCPEVELRLKKSYSPYLLLYSGNKTSYLVLIRYDYLFILLVYFVMVYPK